MASSPPVLPKPHVELPLARRGTHSTVPAGTAGRPERPRWYVHRRRTRCLCQQSKVSGCTSDQPWRTFDTSGSTRRGPLGRRAAIPDGPLGGAGPRPGLGASRPQWPIGLVRCRGAGTTGASERRPRRDRKVPRPAISPGPPRQSPDGRRGWVSRHPHGAGVILTSFPYCTVTLGDGAVAFVDLAILLERPVSRDGSSRLDS